MSKNFSSLSQRPMTKPNAILYTTHKNYIRLWAIDMEEAGLECYRRNPFESADLPLIIVKNEIAQFWYESRRPNTKTYRLILLGDAYSENGITIYQSGRMFNKFKTRRD